MKKLPLLASFGALLLLVATTARADFSCAIASGIPFCTYKGKISAVYANETNEILMYIPSPFDLSLVSAQGISGVAVSNAFKYPTYANPDFARMLYATLLAAQAQNRDVTVQMRKVNGGYLSIDRIWLN